jgi:hypothetical protein
MRAAVGYFSLSVILGSCGPQGQIVELDMTSKESLKAQQDEPSVMGLSAPSSASTKTSPSMPLRERLEGVDATFARSLVSFISPADPNRICRGALGYEVPWLALSSGWGEKVKDNYFWGKKTSVDVFLYTDRRCLMDSSGKYPKQKVDLTAWIYRSASPNRPSLELVQSKITYDPVHAHTLNANNSTTVARLWQFTINKPSSSRTPSPEIMELPSFIHPVCPMEQGYGNIDYKIQTQHFLKSTDPTGLDEKSAALFVMRTFTDQNLNSYSAGAAEFIKSENKDSIVQTKNQSTPVRKIKLDEIGGPVFFTSTASKNPLPSCLYGTLSHPDFLVKSTGESVFPEIRELRGSWYTLEKVNIPATRLKAASIDYAPVVFSADLLKLPKTETRLNLKFSELSVSEHVFGKLGPMAVRRAIATPAPIVQNCATLADAAEVNALQEKLVPVSNGLLVSDKQYCDQLEKDGNAKCKAEYESAGSGAEMACRARQEWYSGGRVGCYIDRNNERSPEIKRLKELMKPFVDSGCYPSEGRATYDKPSEIDLNSANTAG